MVSPTNEEIMTSIKEIMVVPTTEEYKTLINGIIDTTRDRVLMEELKKTILKMWEGKIRKEEK